MSEIIQLKNPLTGELQYPIGYAQGGMKMDLLWTNPSPTSTFAEQIVSLDLSDYTYLMVTVKYQTSVNIYNTIMFGTSQDAQLFIMRAQAPTYFRNVQKTNNGLAFSTGYSSGSGSSAEWVIPLKIYGVKTSYLVPTEVHGLTYIDDDTNGNITLYNNDGTKVLYPKAQLRAFDKTRVLATNVSSYTATEDCFVLMNTNNQWGILYVDGVGVLTYGGGMGTAGNVAWTYVAKGQSVSRGNATTFTVYGLKA